MQLMCQLKYNVVVKKNVGLSKKKKKNQEIDYIILNIFKKN